MPDPTAISTVNNKRRVSSFGHKLRRIRKQELFKQKKSGDYGSLTHREHQVLTLLARDYNNPKIARKLYISRATVEQHRKNINRKLKVNSFGQIFQYALAFDLMAKLIF